MKIRQCTKMQWRLYTQVQVNLMLVVGRVNYDRFWVQVKEKLEDSLLRVVLPTEEEIAGPWL